VTKVLGICRCSGPVGWGGRVYWFVPLLLALGGCTQTPDEIQIERAIDAMAEAARGRDLRALFGFIAEDFRGKDGMDRQGLRRLVAFHLLRNRKVGLLLTGTHIDVLSPTATVRLNLGLTGGQGMLPERARLYRVEARWRKRDDGEWYVIEADWERVLGVGGS
jgi:ketosteroid isomerase-like protein